MTPFEGILAIITVFTIGIFIGGFIQLLSSVSQTTKIMHKFFDKGYRQGHIDGYDEGSGQAWYLAEGMKPTND